MEDQNQNLAFDTADHPPILPSEEAQLIKPTTMAAWTPKQAKLTIESRAVPPVTFDPSKQTAAGALSPKFVSDSGVVQGVDSIAELARALNNDPHLIYQFVHDNISYYPAFGVSKGPFGALLDGAGSAFDQAMLMVALLRQAGFTANYVLGQIQLTAAQVASWLGCATDQPNSNAASNIFALGGVPNTWTTKADGSLDTITLTHCWVQVNIAGTFYVYDPSFKAHTYKTGINLTTASGYSQSDLLTAMQTGATIDPNGDFVQNLNHTAMNAKLATYATNLVNYIKTNIPDATMDDVVGGRQIVPATIPLSQTVLPYEAPGDVPTIWTGDVPNNYKITITINFANVFGQVVLTSDQVCGRRLNLYPNASGFATLTLDGVVLATATNMSSGTSVSIKHNAYPNSNNNNNYYTQSTGGLLALSFGMPGRGMPEHHRTLMQQAIANGQATDTEPVFGEGQAAIGCDYYGELCKAISFGSSVFSTSGGYSAIFHNHVGMVQYSPLYTYAVLDYGSIIFSSLYMNNSLPWAQPIYSFAGPHASGMEALVLKHDVGTGMSAATYVPFASQSGYKIFLTTGTNLTSVKAQCTFWNQYALQAVPAGYLISQHGGLALDNWQGDAWQGFTPGTGSGYISGYLHGGSVTQPVTIGGFIAGLINGNRKPTPRPGKTTGDPIDVFSGAFTVNQTGLSLGAGDFPYTLAFEPRYDSSSRFSDGVLGLGWTHNYKWNVAVSSDGYKGLGDDSPIEGAAAIVAALAIIDIASGFAGLGTYTVVAASAMALTEYWLIGQLSSNTVVMKTPTTEEVFYKLADGSYHSPLGLTGTLTLTGGLYTYKSPDQVAYNFNSAGDLATIVYPFGVTVTLNYTAGVLTSITNGMGRTLTLNYTSGRLTSVTDGTGRSVSYLVDANKNLTQFTDANGKLTTYAYGQPGLMTQMFLPQNPASTIFTNVFDTLGRIQTQADALNNLSTYRFAGPRSQETDPVGNNKVWYFNRFGDVTQSVDALGNKTVSVYDGRRRRTSVTFPEGNKFAYTFDDKNNVLTSTASPKPGSPLANIVNVFTYDATYNKVHTAKDGRNNITTYNFDPSTGNLLNIQRPIIGGQTPTVVFAYNTRGQVLTRTDETGIITKYTYDATTEKLLSKIVDFGTGTHLNLTTQYGYNTVGDVTSIIDPRLHTTTFLVDVLRRTYQKTDPTPFSYVTKWTYDDNSQPIKVEKQTNDALNPWQTTQISYSLSGKRKTVTDPSNNVLTLSYDLADRLSQIKDAELRAYAIAYDARDKVYTITDPTSTVAETRTYTANGKLYQLTDARAKVTTFSYDGFDRQDRQTFPGGSYQQNQSYDANSNVLTVRTRSANTIVNTFDVLNRLATRTPQGQPQVTFSYDLAGRLTKGNKPTVAGDPSTGDFQFFYDGAGRAYKEQYPDAKTVVHVLDANGNVTKTTYPDSYFVDRIYDELDRLTDIKLNGAAGASAVVFQWDALSRRKKMTFSNGVVTDFGYELDDDAASLLHTFVGSSVSFGYGSNKVHQMTSQSVSDSLFMWHPAAAGTTTYGTANNLNQYPTVGGVAQTYNTNGCLTGDGTWTFGYDTENHLLSATKTGVSASYVYDSMHRQAQKVVGSVKTRFIYSGWQRLADYDGVANTLLSRYVHGPGLDDPIIQISSAGVATFLHQERQGSVVATTGSTGAVSNRYAYSPFGESAAIAGTTIGFQGQRYDAETGLYYFKSRHYSPVTGRFLQPDVIGYNGGLNLYAFVYNDPFSLNDAYGTQGLVFASPVTVPPPAIPGPLTQPPAGMPEGVPTNPGPGEVLPPFINIHFEFIPWPNRGEGKPKIKKGGGISGPVFSTPANNPNPNPPDDDSNKGNEKKPEDDKKPDKKGDDDDDKIGTEKDRKWKQNVEKRLQQMIQELDDAYDEYGRDINKYAQKAHEIMQDYPEVSPLYEQWLKGK